MHLYSITVETDMCYVIVCVMLWVIVSVWCFLSVTLCVNVRVHITVTHKPSFAQGDQLSNHANPNTLQWGTLRENLDKLERDIHDKGIPFDEDLALHALPVSRHPLVPGLQDGLVEGQHWLQVQH